MTSGEVIRTSALWEKWGGFRSGPRQPPPEEVVVCCGKRGSGKTSVFAKRYLRGVVRVFAYDPMREYEELLGGPRLSIEELEERERAGLLYSGVQRITVRPTRYGESTRVEEFDRFCALALRVGNCCVCVEEVSLVASPNSVPDSFGELLAVGRHRRASVLVIGQRFAQFPRLATSQASRIVAFRQPEPADCKDLEGRVGGAWDDRPEMPEVRKIARMLPPFYFLDYTAEEGIRLRWALPAGD